MHREEGIVRFKVLLVLLLKIQVFRDVTLCLNQKTVISSCVNV